MTTKLIDAIEKSGLWTIESTRAAKGHQLARGLKLEAVTEITDHSTIKYSVKGSQQFYDVLLGFEKIHDTMQLNAWCPCIDWKQGGMHETPQRPCKHLLAVFEQVQIPDGYKVTPGDLPVREDDTDNVQDWPARISEAIGKAIQKLADQLWEVIDAGEVPLAIGPTGCGKTSAARLIATDRMCGQLVEHSGADSWTDSDLVGFVHANGERFPGPVATACNVATLTDSPVLLFLDEFTRYNRRVQDGLMQFLLPIGTKVAAAMGYDAASPIRRATAPFWGDTWAETDRLKVVLACNPWGTELDPALVRRTTPVQVGFDQGVASLLGGKLQAAVTASWRATEDGSLPLPIEYQALARTKSPNDLGLVAGYIRRLKALDPGAAEAYLAMLGGLGIKQDELK